jgi:hypothetical protein
MKMYYVICEYEKVKDKFPEFNTVMKNLETKLLAKAMKDWTDSYGGMYPESGQFGKTTIQPSLFNGLAAAFQPLTTWNQWFNATGMQTILSGSGGGGAGTIYEDYKIGICGLAFLSKAIRISEIKMQISDAKLPRINIEEALAYNKPAIVFEDSWILDEKAGFHLYALVNSQGPQRIKPIGLQLNKIPNKLQVSDTGTPLT